MTVAELQRVVVPPDLSFLNRPPRQLPMLTDAEMESRVATLAREHPVMQMLRDTTSAAPARGETVPTLAEMRQLLDRFYTYSRIQPSFTRLPAPHHALRLRGGGLREANLATFRNRPGRLDMDRILLDPRNRERMWQEIRHDLTFYAAGGESRAFTINPRGAMNRAAERIIQRWHVGRFLEMHLVSPRTPIRDFFTMLRSARVPPQMVRALSPVPFLGRRAIRRAGRP
jgi:hypothetical protein